MKKRRQMIIDKNFQYKTTFSVIGTILFILGLVTIFLGVYSAGNNSKLSNTTYKLEETIIDQNHIINALKEYSDFKNIKEREIVSIIISKNLDRNITLMKTNILTIKEIIRSNNMMIIIILIFIMLQCIILYFLVIRKTNRISGPIYVMTNYIRDALSGKDVNLRELRNNDEFKELYQLLGELISKKENEGKK